MGITIHPRSCILFRSFQFSSKYFAIRDARVCKLRFDVALVADLCAGYVKMHLAETLQKDVAGFCVLFDRNGGDARA